MAAAGGMAPLLGLLGSGSEGVQEGAVGALGMLADCNHAIHSAIVAASAIPPLQWLLGSATVRVQVQAAMKLAILRR